MRVLSLCSGYGGLEMALEMAGVDVELTAYAEIDPYASAVMASHHLGVPNLGDIKTIDWEEWMAARRNDEKAKAMYVRYCDGLSLAQVADEFGVTRQTVFKMFERRAWDLRERPPLRESIEFNGEVYSLRDVGYYARTTGDRDYIHRDVWRFYNGAIPDGWDVHHKDHDTSNNDITNLECLPKAAHTRKHWAEKGVMPSDSPVVDILTAGYP